MAKEEQTTKISFGLKLKQKIHSAYNENAPNFEKN
jgi:hypothetical protein